MGLPSQDDNWWDSRPCEPNSPEQCVKRKHPKAYIGYASNGLGVWNGEHPNQLLSHRAIEKANRATDEFKRSLWQIAAVAIRDPDDTPQPERIEGDEPQCPYCGLFHEVLDPPEDFTIDCECGWRFTATTKVVFISAPLEYRR